MSELSQEARNLIDNNLASDEPSAADRLRLRNKLTAQLGAAAFAGAVGAMTSVSASTGSGLGAGSAASSSATLHIASLSTLMKSAMAAGLAGVIGATAWLSQPPVPAAPVDAAPSSALVAVTPAAEPSPEPALELKPRVEPLTPSEASAEAEPNAKPPASNRRAQATEPNSLPLELALLAKAQDALRGENPKLALQIVDDHRRRFPHGALRDERYGIAALARCALGDNGAVVLAELTRLSPHSPLLGRVRAACKAP